MTVKADLTAVTAVITQTAKNSFFARGINISAALAAIQQDITDLQTAIKQVISFHPNDSVLTATVVSGGSSGTTGPVVVSGTTGAGSKFTAKGNIVAGALVGPLTIVSGGMYSADPGNIAVEPVVGGNLSGATVSVTMSGDTANLTALSNLLAELA
jgi:hypothetical protein